MHKPFLFLLCLNLAGIFLLSACDRTMLETQMAEAVLPSPTSEKPSTLPPPTLTATSTKNASSSSTPAVATKKVMSTVTPTTTKTQSVEEIAAKIDLLLRGLATDLENTITIQENEIP